MHGEQTRANCPKRGSPNKPDTTDRRLMTYFRPLDCHSEHICHSTLWRFCLLSFVHVKFHFFVPLAIHNTAEGTCFLFQKWWKTHCFCDVSSSCLLGHQKRKSILMVLFLAQRPMFLARTCTSHGMQIVFTRRKRGTNWLTKWAQKKRPKWHFGPSACGSWAHSNVDELCDHKFKFEQQGSFWKKKELKSSISTCTLHKVLSPVT